MWKVEFTAYNKSVVLYIASDALIVSAETTLTLEEQTKLFTDRFEILAFYFYRQMNKSGQNIYYIRSFFAADENLQTVFPHNIQIGDEKASLPYVSLKGLGKQMTNGLLAYRTFTTEEITSPDEKLPHEMMFRDRFDEHKENTKIWLDFLKRDKKPPNAKKIIPYTSIESARDLQRYIKNNIIISLYNAACDYYCMIWTETSADQDALKNMIKSFNEKFQGFAYITPNLRMSDFEYAMHAWKSKTLRNDDKNFCMESAVYELLSRCARTENILSNINPFNKYGVAFQCVKKRLDDFSAMSNKQLCAPQNAETMLYASTKEFAFNPGVVGLTQIAPIIQAPYVELASDAENNEESVAAYIKNNIITALYNAVLDYYNMIWNEWVASEKPTKELSLAIESFNKKFHGFAHISADTGLSSLQDAMTSWQALSLKNEDKDLCLETAVHNLLARCAPTESVLFVLNIFKNYGPAFHCAKERLNAFNVTGSKRLGVALGSGQMLYASISEPLEENIGIVTNRVPIMKQATHLISNVTLKAAETVRLKDKAREFLFNPAVMGLKLVPATIPEQTIPASPPLSPQNLRRSKDEVAATIPAIEAQERIESDKENEPVNAPDRAESPYDFNATMRELDSIRDEIEYEENITILRKPPFYKNPPFKRIMLGAAIGFGLAAIAATIVCVALFSGGTILAPIAAAAAVAAIGGVLPSILTIISGVIAATLIGAGVGAAVNTAMKSHKQKNRPFMPPPEGILPPPSLEDTSDYQPVRRSSTTQSSDALPDSTPLATTATPTAAASLLSRIKFNFFCNKSSAIQTPSVSEKPRKNY